LASKEELMPGPTPYLCCSGAAEAIDFYQKAFGAEVLERYDDHGRIGHAELRVAGGALMLADEYPEIGFRSPLSLGGVPFQIHLAVPDVDAWCERARAAGAQVLQPPVDQHGGRRCRLRDPFGFVWGLSSER
jgi:PhnB protein